MSGRKFRSRHQFKGKRRKSTNTTGFQRLGSDFEVESEIVGDRQSTDVNADRQRVAGVDSEVPCSSTSRKLEKYEENVYNMHNKYNNGNRIVEFQFLENLVGSLCCSVCKGNHLFLEEIAQDGLASTISVSCSDCFDVKKFSTSHRIKDKNTKSSYEVNRLAVSAFREIGCGQAASQSWFGTMNIPSSLCKSTFASHSKILSTAASETAYGILKDAGNIVRKTYVDIDPTLGNEEVIDISVAFDGTWHRRGHRSHYGVGILTDLLTGLVIDYEVKSTYCFGCQSHENDDKNCQKYKDWLNFHAQECSQNFSGSASAMESAAALDIWKRSIEKHKFRYTVLLGDGDSKTYHDLLKAKPYGEIEISKEECVNHVSKRMGTALKNLVAQCRAEGVPISGKGRLTQERILKIQNYYGKAIKDNSNDLDAMRNAV